MGQAFRAPREGDPDRPCAMNWTTGDTLGSLVERYKRDGNPEHAETRTEAVPRADHPGDLGHRPGVQRGRDGRLARREVAAHWVQSPRPSILVAVSRYWEVTHDPETLEFAEAFADGQVAALQPHGGDCRIRPDGTFGGHNSHLHMRAVLGVAHLGALPGEPRYVTSARGVYEYPRSLGTDLGMVPRDSLGRRNSETCNTADMMDVARWLANAGLTEYWDHVERYVRNYVGQAQWFVTPEIREIYRSSLQGQPRRRGGGRIRRS